MRRAFTRDGSGALEVVAGLCICGGASRRMGRDKAELDIGGQTLLDRAIATLSEVAPRVLLATGAHERYAERGLEVVLDRYADAGPLAGLEAGLTAVRANADGEALVVVLACDMPRVGADLLRVLLSRAAGDREIAASLFVSESGPEPLCGVYRTSVLPAIRAALDAGERKMLAFASRRVANGATARVAWTSAEDIDHRADAAPAFNVNTPEDLVWLRARFAEGGTA